MYITYIALLVTQTYYSPGFKKVRIVPLKPYPTKETSQKPPRLRRETYCFLKQFIQQEIFERKAGI